METVRTENKMKALDIAYVAMGVALITVCAFITVPMAVPFTLQTFAVFSALLILGWKRGTMSVAVYILMGAIGLPVFSGFKGGLGVLFGKTGGYIIGFLFIGLIYAIATNLIGRKIYVEVSSLALGLLVCYAFGTAWFMYIYMRDTGAVGLLTVLSWCVFPFLIPDAIKLTIALLVSRRVRNVIK